MGTTARNGMALCAFVALAVPLGGQEHARAAEEAYFRAVARFFDVPAAEISILRDWRVPPEEISVVLFVARRAGVSAEALLAMRRADRSWSDLAGRYRVGPAALYVPLPDDAPAGRLNTAYESYRSLPSARWGEIRLSDADIVALVNVRLLAETVGISPAEVLRRAGAARSFVETYGELIR